MWVVRKVRGDAALPQSLGRGEESEEEERDGERERPPDTEMAQCPAGYAESAIVLAGLPFPRFYGQQAEFVAVPYI